MSAEQGHSFCPCGYGKLQCQLTDERSDMEELWS